MALVTMKHLPQAAGISRASLYRLIDEGLPYTVVGAKRMYDVEQVKEFIRNRKSKLEQPLIVGEEYTNQQIVSLFRVKRTGGMRKSNTMRSLVLFACHLGDGRFNEDYWKDGVLYFTGGEQSIEQGLNQVLAQSDRNGVTVYLFELFTEPSFRYRGIVKLAGEPFEKQVQSKDGSTRTVWKFPLCLADAKDYVPRAVLLEQRRQAESELAQELVQGKLSKSLLELAQCADRAVSEIATTSKSYIRSPILSRFAKQRAGGRCELCNQSAPFWVGEEPFLELHHIIPVNEGGRDRANNVTALCPNCHRRVHCLKDPKDIEQILKNIEIDNWVLDGCNESRVNVRRIVPCFYCGGRNKLCLEELCEAEIQELPNGQRASYKVSDTRIKCSHCAQTFVVAGCLSEYPLGTLEQEKLWVSPLNPSVGASAPNPDLLSLKGKQAKGTFISPSAVKSFGEGDGKGEKKK